LLYWPCINSCFILLPHPSPALFVYFIRVLGDNFTELSGLLNSQPPPKKTPNTKPTSEIAVLANLHPIPLLFPAEEKNARVHVKSDRSPIPRKARDAGVSFHAAAALREIGPAGPPLLEYPCAAFEGRGAVLIYRPLPCSLDPLQSDRSPDWLHFMHNCALGLMHSASWHNEASRRHEVQLPTPKKNLTPVLRVPPPPFVSSLSWPFGFRVVNTLSIESNKSRKLWQGTFERV